MWFAGDKGDRGAKVIMQHHLGIYSKDVWSSTSKYRGGYVQSILAFKSSIVKTALCVTKSDLIKTANLCKHSTESKPAD
jgi:hypothetical protein